MKKLKPIKVFSILFMNVPASKIKNLTAFANKNQLNILVGTPENFKEFVSFVREQSHSQGAVAISQDSKSIYLAISEKTNYNDIKKQIG